MKLQKRYQGNAKVPNNPQSLKGAGFTLVEVVVVIGILAILAGLGLVLSMDFYRVYTFNYEQDLVVSILQKARSQAMANINQTSHGVCVIGSNYILSEGASCASGTTFPKSGAITVTWPTPIIFSQLAGSCSACPLTVTLTGLGKTANISINNEGQIDW